MALLIWSPLAYRLVFGNVELWFAGAAFLAALALAFVGVEIIGNITDGYAKTSRRLDAAKRQIEMIERRKAQTPQRRQDDTDREPPPDS